MQKVINVLALSSFAVSVAVVAGGVYLYTQKDVIINDIKRDFIKGATEGVQNALPGMLDGATPSVPTDIGGTTGQAPGPRIMPVVPF